jgi:uncharacterized membrane protein HdeD (DUF308 family)
MRGPSSQENEGYEREIEMRALGVILLVLGIVALLVPSITFFTTDRVADAGFFKIDVSRPHTIVLNPITGMVGVVAGLALILAGRKTV